VTRSLFSPANGRLREWLIAARRERKLTQILLAATLGRPQSFVSKYERGERRLDFVEVLEIAKALDANTCELAIEVGRALR
jgi:transcriptional regulator with XRE-family HTH domain